MCAVQHVPVSRGWSPGWNRGALEAKVLRGLIGLPFAHSGVLSMSTVCVLLGFLWLSEFGRKGSILCSSFSGVRLTLIKHDYPCLPRHFEHWKPTCALCLASLGIAPGSALCSCLCFLARQLLWLLRGQMRSAVVVYFFLGIVSWEGGDPRVSEGIGRQRFRNPKNTAFLSPLPFVSPFS